MTFFYAPVKTTDQMDSLAVVVAAAAAAAL